MVLIYLLLTSGFHFLLLSSYTSLFLPHTSSSFPSLPLLSLRSYLFLSFTQPVRRVRQQPIGKSSLNPLHPIRGRERQNQMVSFCFCQVSQDFTTDGISLQVMPIFSFPYDFLTFCAVRTYDKKNMALNFTVVTRKRKWKFVLELHVDTLCGCYLRILYYSLKIL